MAFETKKNFFQKVNCLIRNAYTQKQWVIISQAHKYLETRNCYLFAVDVITCLTNCLWTFPEDILTTQTFLKQWTISSTLAHLLLVKHRTSCSFKIWTLKAITPIILFKWNRSPEFCNTVSASETWRGATVTECVKLSELIFIIPLKRYDLNFSGYPFC